MTKEPCLFDNDIECPVRNAVELPSDSYVLEKACPMCPIHVQLMEKARLAQRQKSIEEIIKEQLSS